MVCPACDAEQRYSECELGQLGRLSHFKCRNCGVLWSERGPDQLVYQEDDV